MQAANGTAGIEHVYVTLTTLWKFFYYSLKCAQSLKEVQKVLDFPELKLVKPSYTRWVAHERCVRAVKTSYSAIAICKKSTIAAIYLLDYVLPQVAKLSRALQTENLDLTMISSLLDATLHSIDDAVLSSSNWVLELLRCVRTSASIRFGATSIPFALHANFPGSGSKLDRIDPHTVGGLK